VGKPGGDAHNRLAAGLVLLVATAIARLGWLRMVHAGPSMAIRTERLLPRRAGPCGSNGEVLAQLLATSLPRLVTRTLAYRCRRLAPVLSSRLGQKRRQTPCGRATIRCRTMQQRSRCCVQEPNRFDGLKIDSLLRSSE